MICPFVVGQHVVSVVKHWEICRIYEGGFQEKGPTTAGPPFGTVCKIAEITVAEPTDIVILKLKGYDGSFDWRGFRPLQDRPKEASIEVFKKLLTPTKVVEPTHGL